eukprot:6713841-Prymnesium_polylepis.1
MHDDASRTIALWGRPGRHPRGKADRAAVQDATMQPCGSHTEDQGRSDATVSGGPEPRCIHAGGRREARQRQSRSAPCPFLACALERLPAMYPSRLQGTSAQDYVKGAEGRKVWGKR